MIKQIFVNLPVKDVKKSITFFTKVGFTFNKEFTDDNVACMIIGEKMFAMLIGEKLFKTFVKKEIADTKKTTEMINSLQVDTKKEVDDMFTKAIKEGAIEQRELQDHGWMYVRNFQDIDGHLWEVFWMDESKRLKDQESGK